MLVLTRRTDESIMIGSSDGDIEIVVVAVDGGKVRIGINAPKGLPIYRFEVWESIRNARLNNETQTANKAASGDTVDSAPPAV